MTTAVRNKIAKPLGKAPDTLELTVAQYLLELEQASELKTELRGLQISSAKEVSVQSILFTVD